ncbi:Dirigent protein 15, partial [Mucuna pruriens]
MEKRRMLLVMGMLLWSFSFPIGTRSKYYRESRGGFDLKEKVSHLHFYVFDMLSGDKPSAVEVAHSNSSVGAKSATPFGHVYAMDDPLKEGPYENSKVVGNAQGLYLSSSQDEKSITLMVLADFAFSTGKFKGSSISIFSRNPVSERKREVAVVGGRGKFRMARGFARLRTHYLNPTNGNAIVEYNVTVLHY